MAWETRNGRGRYYTRSKREGGRVVREYIGRGDYAEALAYFDAHDREEAEDRRREARAERDRARPQEEALAAFCRGVEAVTRRALEEAGYHRHDRGRWRKRRGGTDGRLLDGGEAGMAQKDTAAIKQEQAIRAAEVPESSAERHAVLSRALDGDKKAEAQALAVLRRHPDEFVVGYGNPRGAVVELAGGGTPLVRQMVGNEYDRKLREVAGPDPDPLERVLAERVVVCRMQVTYWEADYAAALRKTMTLAQSDFKQRRIDGAHRRLLSAVKALAQVRRLALPAVQVNIAEHQNIADKQINIGQTQNTADKQGNVGGANG